MENKEQIPLLYFRVARIFVNLHLFCNIVDIKRTYANGKKI